MTTYLDGVLYFYLFIFLSTQSLRSVLVFSKFKDCDKKTFSTGREEGPSISLYTNQSSGIKVVKFISALRKIQ